MKFTRYTLAIAFISMIASLANAGLDVGNTVDSFAANDDQGNL